ncbi:MAG: DUF4421 family protein [Pseudomonadota bacterium]
MSLVRPLAFFLVLTSIHRPASAATDLRVRLFTRYQKGALTFGRADETKNDVLVVYPAAVPAVGAAIQWNKMFTAGWSVSLPKTNFIDERLRGSRFQHLEAHSTPSPFAFDAHYLRYEGLFAAKESKIDIRPFQDSLFKGNQGATAFPGMTMESFSGGAIYNFDDDRVKFGALLNQSTRPGESGLARCLVSQIREARFKNNRSLDSSVLDHSSGRMQAVALGPGIAAQYVDGDRYIGGVGFVAPAYSRSRISGQSAHDGFATFLKIRGSLGFNDGLRAWGLSGNKSLLTIDRRDMSMTDSVSSIELFYLASY